MNATNLTELPRHSSEPADPKMNPFLRALFVNLIVRPLVLLVFGLNLRGKEHLPSEGPAIVVGNHNSHLDTLVLMALFSNRTLPRVRPLAAADYWMTHPVLAWFATRVIGIIPIDRKTRGDRERVLAGAKAALERGEILVLFPEGKRGLPEVREPFKSGVATLAEQFPEVPVVPVYTHGMGKILPRGEAIPVPFFCDVVVGAPLHGGADKYAFMADLERRFDDLEASQPRPAWT